MKKAISVSLATLLLFFILSATSFLFSSLFEIKSNHAVFLGIFSLSISALLLSFLYRFRYSLIQEFKDIANVDLKILVLFFATSLFFHVSLNPISNLFIILSLSNLETYFVNLNKSFLFITYVVVIAPVLEEFIFRKFLVSKILEYTNSKVLAIWMSSIVFALIHLPSISSLIATFFLGAICAALYISTKKVIIPIFFHSTYNLIAVLYSNLFVPQYVDFLSEVHFGLFYWFIWLTGLIIFIFLIKHVLKNHQKLLKNQ